MIVNLEKLMAAEEQEDNQLRMQHGANFQRIPSASVNQAYKQSINDYKMKLQQASVSDGQILQKFNMNKDGFKILAKTRGEISALIPSSGNSSVEQNPVVVTIKNCMDELNQVSNEKDAVMAEGVAMHEQLNAVEDLMKVQAKAATKDEVFKQFVDKYTAHFARSEELEKRRQEISQTIASNGQAFAGLLSQASQSPEKMQFFTQLNDSIAASSMLGNMLEQCNQFYQQINDRLVKLEQQVNDYIMSRNMQRDDCLRMMQGGQQQMPPQQPMMGYGQMPPQ
jgi:hypothetical protein